MRIIRMNEVSSTNVVVRELYDNGERDPVWVTAERQSQGRGRLERHWVSEAGNVYASALLPKPDGPPGAMAFIAALAVAETLSDFIETPTVALKWPNDALVDRRKISGVLCEMIDDHVICGVGINVSHHPQGTRWPATHLAAHNYGVNVRAVFERLAIRFQEALDLNVRQGWDGVRGSWLTYAYGLGREVSVDLGDRRLAGRFRGIGLLGEFLLSTPSGTVPIVAGDVTYTG